MKKTIKPIKWIVSPQLLSCMACNSADAEYHLFISDPDNGPGEFNFVVCARCAELEAGEIFDLLTVNN